MEGEDDDRAEEGCQRGREEENRPQAEQQVEEDAIEAKEEARPDAQAEEVQEEAMPDAQKEKDEARPDGQAEEEARLDAQPEEDAKTDAHTEAVEPGPERHEDDAHIEASVLVPGPPLAPLQGTRGSTSATYSMVYEYTDGLWQNWRDHMLHEDKRVPVTLGIPWESHQDYLPWFRRVSHLKVARGRRDGHNTEIAEERTAAALVLLDSCLSGTHISPFDMKNTLCEVQRILRGQDAAHPSTPEHDNQEEWEWIPTPNEWQLLEEADPLDYVTLPLFFTDYECEPAHDPASQRPFGQPPENLENFFGNVQFWYVKPTEYQLIRKDDPLDTFSLSHLFGHETRLSLNEINRQHQAMNVLGKEYNSDPSKFIVPDTEPKPIVYVPEEPEVLFFGSFEMGNRHLMEGWTERETAEFLIRGEPTVGDETWSDFVQNWESFQANPLDGYSLYGLFQEPEPVEEEERMDEELHSFVPPMTFDESSTLHLTLTNSFKNPKDMNKKAEWRTCPLLMEFRSLCFGKMILVNPRSKQFLRMIIGSLRHTSLENLFLGQLHLFPRSPML
ncbi:hypothetical protein RHSIM_Rhsim06G0111000 [Rhododendron simsii]|uniref:Uncharacterized protein n=1 Tax=Rhododendron simsii TaxID=118357 RepID=A0A834LKL2_RHOSS|nr:hypothetical protein RHSIM_Rhsim06G0111000 [Rhododendron simsii]